jgi:hypothetical protein
MSDKIHENRGKIFEIEGKVKISWGAREIYLKIGYIGLCNKIVYILLGFHVNAMNRWLSNFMKNKIIV